MHFRRYGTPNMKSICFTTYRMEMEVVKKTISLILIVVILYCFGGSAYAYPDGSSTNEKTSLPYCGSFSIKQSVKTKYWFSPSGSTLHLALSHIDLAINKNCTLKTTVYYYTSGGKWASGGSGSVSVIDGLANDKSFDFGSVAGRKYCGGFSKSEYLDYNIAGDFRYAN